MATVDQFAKFKTWIGVTGTTYDADIMRVLDAALDWAGQYTGLRLNAPESYTETWDGEGGTSHASKEAPLVSVESLVVDSTTIPLSASYSVSGYFLSGNFIRLRGYEFNSGSGNCVMTYTAGYDPAPGPIVQACFEIAGIWWEERNRIGMKSKSLGQENVTFHETHLTEGVKAALDAYRRFSL